MLFFLPDGFSRSSYSSRIDTADTFKYYANLVVEREKEQNKAIDVGNPSFECYVRREPVGVCGTPVDPVLSDALL